MPENRPLTTALDWAKPDAFGLRTWPDCDTTMNARGTEKPRPRMEKIPIGRTLERNRAPKDRTPYLFEFLDSTVGLFGVGVAAAVASLRLYHSFIVPVFPSDHRKMSSNCGRVQSSFA